MCSSLPSFHGAASKSQQEVYELESCYRTGLDGAGRLFNQYLTWLNVECPFFPLRLLCADDGAGKLFRDAVPNEFRCFGVNIWPMEFYLAVI